MPPPKKVAIIGAGPSGLVTAKTLLHDFPRGTFVPTILEKSPVVGGLWPTTNTTSTTDVTTTTTGLIDPHMRTNLSRFTVSFSDFPWEVSSSSVLEDRARDADVDVDPDAESDTVPMFPRAWQVGRYLVRYAERYLPAGVIRLGREVVGVCWRGEGVLSWEVRWVEAGREHTESFDFLVMASGYFASPYIPDIPGLDTIAEQKVVVEHSSAVNSETDVNRLLSRIGPPNRNETENDNEKKKEKEKIVVIGASMSGVETASALALHLSSSRLSSSTQPHGEYEIHHVCSRPFWTVPYYLPHGNAIVPLDLAFYDMDRRPPGDIEYGFGPISPQQVSKTNEYFRRLLGTEYERIGSVGVSPTGEDQTGSAPSPSWTAIGDDYAEYIRSGGITTTFGRVICIRHGQNGQAQLDIQHRGRDDVVSMENVSAIVMATGFTPYTALSILPENVLSRLEFSEEDPFIPLILDGMGTSNVAVPGIGFVGFYRGPYWGVMEMQARSLGQAWSRAADDGRPSNEDIERKDLERNRLRGLRGVDNRSQFPMGDYVGLMESFAREMGIERTPFLVGGRDDGDSANRGPVVPARYVSDHHREAADVTLASLAETISPTPGTCALAAATAVFRALHGTWEYTTTDDSDEHGGYTWGKSTFYPRYPSSPEYEKEYICKEMENGVSTRFIYQLSAHAGVAQVFVTPMDAAKSHRLALQFSHYQFDEEGPFIQASCIYPENNDEDAYRYTFRFTGVTISSWECIISFQTPERTHRRTVYIRPT